MMQLKLTKTDSKRERNILMNNNDNDQRTGGTQDFLARVRDQERELEARVSFLNRAVLEYALIHGQYQTLSNSKH